MEQCFAYTVKRRNKISFNSGIGSLMASRSLSATEAGDWPTHTPILCLKQKEPIPFPIVGQIQQTPYDTHTVDKRVLIVPETGKNIPTPGDKPDKLFIS